MQLAGRHLRLTGILFIFRADNEGELKLPSFVVVRDKVILCSFTEGAGTDSLNQRKFRHELGVLEGPGEKRAHRGDLHKWKKEKIIHRAGKDLRSY